MNRQTATIFTAALTLVVVATADARIVRRGGGGARVAPAIAGTATYLLPIRTEVGGSYVPYVDGDRIAETQVSSLPRYSFTNDGSPIQAHHNWGSACSEGRQVPGEPLGSTYDCFFLLGLDESLNLGGHIVGLPDPSEYKTDTPVPTLNYQWTLTAGTQIFSFDQDSPEAPLGETRPRNPEDPDGFEEFCFARFFTYTDGVCQLLDFDSGALTGAALLDAAAGGDIFLDLSVELLAPEGFEFVNITDFDSGLTDNLGEVVPWDSAPLLVLEAGAQRLPVRVDVPAPGTVLLFITGAALLLRRREFVKRAARDRLTVQ